MICGATGSLNAPLREYLLRGCGGSDEPVFSISSVVHLGERFRNNQLSRRCKRALIVARVSKVAQEQLNPV